MVAVEVRFREAIREASRMLDVGGRTYQALSLNRLNGRLYLRTRHSLVLVTRGREG